MSDTKEPRPIDLIVKALSEIVKAMDEGGIDQFDLSVSNGCFKFSGKRILGKPHAKTPAK